LPDAARLTEREPEGPVTEDGQQLSYGMLVMNEDDRVAHPYIAAYLESHEEDPDGAMAQLDQALELVPGHEDTLTLQAMDLARRGDKDGAIALLRQALAQNERPQAPTFITLTTLLAPIDMDEALAVNQRGLELWPNHVRMLGSLGTLRLIADRPAEAVGPLEQAYRLTPNNHMLRLALAHAYAETGHHVFAMHLAETAYWMSEDEDHRAACAGVVRDSWAQNVRVQGDSVVTTLVPTPPSEGSMDVLADPDASWDVRYEAAAAIAAVAIEEPPQRDPVAELDRLARMRAMTTRIAVATAPERPVHPTAAWHVRADLEGCSVGYHAVVLSPDIELLSSWLDARPAEAQAIATCLEAGLLTRELDVDLSRVTWGIPLR